LFFLNLGGVDVWHWLTMGLVHRGHSDKQVLKKFATETGCVSLETSKTAGDGGRRVRRAARTAIKTAGTCGWETLRWWCAVIGAPQEKHQKV